MKKDRSSSFGNKITFMSFVFCFLVLMIHTNNLTVYNVKSPSLIFFERFMTENIAQLAVPSFLMLSAVLFFYTVSNCKDVFAKQKKRVKTLLVPYLLWNTLNFLFFAALKIVPALGRLINLEVDFSFGGIINGIFFYKYCGSFWFMYQLIIYTALAPIIYMLMKNKKTAIIFMSVTAVLVFCFADKLPLSGNIPYPRIETFLYYIFGAFAGMYYTDYVTGDKRASCKVLWGMLIFSQLCWFAWYKTQIYAFMVIFKLFFCSSVWLIIDAKRIPHARKYMCFTFFVYATQRIFLEVFSKLLWLSCAHTDVTALIEFLTQPPVVMTVILLVATILNKLMPRIFAFLTGGRAS